MTAPSRQIPDKAPGLASDIRQWLHSAAGALARAGVESPDLDAQLILAHARGCDRLHLLRDRRDPLPVPVLSRARTLLDRRIARVPLAQILGRREFWGLEFRVTEATLDPRPDSETLIEELCARFADRGPVRRVLDLGTGTGCLLIALLHEFPGAHGTGIDRSEKACAIAWENARHLGVGDRARFRVADWASGLDEKFDIIVSNPPYIASADIVALQPEIRLHEPREALDGGMDGLEAYRNLAPQIGRLLAAHGVAAIECGAGQSTAVTGIFAAAGLALASTRADLGGVLRCLVFAARHGSQTP